MNKNNNKLVQIKMYSTIADAELDKSFLKSHRISSIVQADRALVYLPVALFVKKKDYKKAKNLLTNK